MDRKEFLKLISLAGVGAPFFLNGMPSRVLNQFLDMQMSCDTVNDRILVIVRMAGANDGLNTVVPVSQYDTYANLRPNIKLLSTGAGAYIPLDTTVSSGKLVGLNPAMSGFKSLYDNGKLTLMNGVGYPNPNYSHFRSESLMFAGKDGSNNQDLLSGIFGRYLGALHPGLSGNPTPANPDPLAIQLGNLNPCLFYEHASERNIEYNLTAIQSQLVTKSAVASSIPASSEYTDLLAYIKDVAPSMDSYYNRVLQVFNSGNNTASITYPNTSLAKQLKTVARMVKGGSKTKIFQVNVGGFDTHVNQVQSGSTNLGTHANILGDVSNSIAAFQADIAALGFEDKVLTVTFSEFGRQVRENASLGTDHGDIAPFFIIGNSVSAGILGDHPVFTNATSFYYNQNQRRFDYRQIFASILQDWLGADTTLLASSELDYFVTSSQKVDVIKDLKKATNVCSVLSTSNIALASGLQVYPIPADDKLYVDFGKQNPKTIAYQLLDFSGRVVISKKLQNTTTKLTIETAALTAGTYLLNIKTDKEDFSNKVIIAH